MRELWETWQTARQTAQRFWTRLSWGASPAYPWNLSLPGTSEGSLKRCATRRGPPFLKVGAALIPHSCDDHPENSFYFLRCVTFSLFFFTSLVCVCSTRTNDACRHKCLDIFEPNVGRKRKINEIFLGGGLEPGGRVWGSQVLERDYHKDG